MAFFMIFSMNCFSLGSRAEQTSCLSVALRLSLLGESFVPVGGVGLALGSSVEIVQSLLRDFGVCRTRREDRGADESNNLFVHCARTIAHLPLEKALGGE